jgi:hypothetical protein
MISKALDAQPANFQVPKIYGSGGRQRPDQKRYQTRCDLQPTLVASFPPCQGNSMSVHESVAFFLHPLGGKLCCSRNIERHGPPQPQGFANHLARGRHPSSGRPEQKTQRNTQRQLSPPAVVAGSERGPTMVQCANLC